MSDSPIRIEEWAGQQGCRIGVACLNSEKSLNALSLPMIELLLPQLQAWQADPQIACVVLLGQGDKAFCAGGDIRAMYEQIRAGNALTACTHFFALEYQLDYLIHTYAKPILVWGKGIVMGGGIGLMAGASHRVVTETSRLAMPEISIGLYPDVGGSWFLSRLPGKVGRFLALTGVHLNASDARFLGMADYQLANDQWEHVKAGLCAQHWPADEPGRKQCLTELLVRLEGDSGVNWPVSPIEQHWSQLLKVCRGHDASAVIQSLLDEQTREAFKDDPWWLKAVGNLQRGSPMSARLGLAMQARCEHLSLREAFQWELVASVRCCLSGEFAEGVRALLVDKDNQPRWSAAHDAAVEEDALALHFVAPWSGPHPLQDL
ncbi:enoyl-CoA hydratase/isomerase family protein [Leeia aquatica]|uniref:3-hydroxyisobutyryl-CoA hydrolase n=1 Tax=Leeia aquatica TaxID=2725557 RepID=A0A847S4P6_9NEIS|nr:enoyl-CoA hydratase/isomerase family protein [Leeia aquatica]NLR73745.1 enoyl-CoA hydratase/isomerase family protein [Leeia aquatica]